MDCPLRAEGSTTNCPDATVRLCIRLNHGLLARDPMILPEFRPGLSGKQSEAIPDTDHPRSGHPTQGFKG
jgi:hypothetical protein